MSSSQLYSEAGVAANSITISKVDANKSEESLDQLAVEEPLEIRLIYHGVAGRTAKTISITMRTPNHDLELAAGFLFTEGIIRGLSDLEALKHCGPVSKDIKSQNIVRVELKQSVTLEVKKLERHFYTTSSCGICGKTSIDALKTQNEYCKSFFQPTAPTVDRKTIFDLPQKMRNVQTGFTQTGGLHAAALFTADGKLTLMREDVGRHNAVDKVIGAALMNDQIPLTNHILLVSGRAGFELVQKAAMAGIHVFSAIGAPSSLAVQFAAEMNMTLIGFLRGCRFNIYHGGWRIKGIRKAEFYEPLKA